MLCVTAPAEVGGVRRGRSTALNGVSAGCPGSDAEECGDLRAKHPNVVSWGM